MIRQRFPADRLFRVGTWALAGVTGTVAFVSNGGEAAQETLSAPEGTVTEIPSAGAAMPVLPDRGLTILRVAPATPVPDPPAAHRGATPGQPTESPPSAAAPAQPAPPPPPLSAAPAPIQSAGS